MPEISIIIATIRESAIRRAVLEIKKCTPEIDYEIIVVTPLDIKIKDVRVIKEEKAIGVNHAFNLGVKCAKGKYIYAMADDQLVQYNCINNLLEDIKQHDDELYLTGARTAGVWGAGMDQTIYGYYYPTNSCIKKSDVEQLGCLYDTYYKRFLGDPDLALRVIHKGGSVSLCRGAWISDCNINDEFAIKNKEESFDSDYEKFFERWHKIYGDGCERKSSSINVGIKSSGGLPMEKCTNFILHILNKDFKQVFKESRKPNHYMNEDNLANLFGVVLLYLQELPFLIKPINFPLQSVLLKFCVEGVFHYPDKEFTLYFDDVKIRKNNLSSSEFRNLIVTGYLLFITNKIKGLSEPIFVMREYKTYNIFYKNKLFYVTKLNSLGDITGIEFSSNEFYKAIHFVDSKVSNSKNIDYLELKYIELILKNTTKGTIQEDIFTIIDYFCNKKVEDRRLTLTTGYFWEREK